ncbi:filamentous hemagglutinin N-terminal domain-containing protein [Nostoc sp. UHCC 0302]|uniref:two-partner secretion domain-containing protein n=1 Tax=Nostoc sp. UHCC 0302 TaxID=3134896 RepID=UPI00311C9184
MTQRGKGRSWQLGLASSLATAGALLSLSITSPFVNSAFAQSAITPDDTLENKSQVINNYRGDPTTEVLTGGTRRSNNLFHSFLEFNVSEGQSAFFLNPSSDIQNILVRVTGSKPSHILGQIGTFGSYANLFLINPNGIVFGAKATLNVSGSFVASTANGIKFNDGAFSDNAPPTTPLLTVSVPIGLQFRGAGGEIKIDGQTDGEGYLQVQPGKTLALVGGNVSLSGRGDQIQLYAPNGQIALGGILGAGTIGLNLENADSNNQILSFPTNVALADVSFSNQTIVDVTGEGGGYIQIQGKRIALKDGSRVDAQTLGSQNGRGIFIQAEQLTIQDGSVVNASTYGEGTGGSLVVKATDFVEVSGINADAKPSGLFAETYSKGAAGDVTIETGRLIVENGGNIAASAREGSAGIGGNLEVTADLIKLSGSPLPKFPSGLFAQTYGSNDAGSLTIKTRQLIVQDGAQIVAGTQPGSQGNGGTLSINASDFIELSGKAPVGDNTSGLFARSLGSGDAGSISITTEQLNVRDQAQVTVSALEGGNAGNLLIIADEIRLDREGKLLAQTTSGNGGNIKLQVENLLQLRNKSQISTTAGTDDSGGGNGGNIKIDTPDGFIVAVPDENSDISANAFGGKGGNVDIKAFGIYGTQPRKKPTQFSDITASSQVGLNGVIRITTPDVNPNERLINLPTQLVQPKLAQVCKANVGRNQNSFTITGRGGVPSSPTEPLSADAVLADWITLDKVNESASNQNVSNANIPTQASPEAIVEANGWEVNAKGEVVLIANASSVTPHTSWQQSTDCDVAQASS